MSEMQSHLKIALASIKCFTDDGELDEGELNYLLGIAKADGHIDSEEARVLRNIIEKALKSSTNTRTERRMKEVLAELG